MQLPQLHDILDIAYQRRVEFLSLTDTNAYRLCHGFADGLPDFCIDRYRTTIVIHDYRETDVSRDLVNAIAQWYVAKTDWVNCIIWKSRKNPEQSARAGQIIYGEKPTTYIDEWGIRYAVDLMMNLDASFYLDTRNLRRWLTANSKDQSVLNMFAYTGSLGVAAKAGGAKNVLQTDLKKKFLAVGQRSMQLNGLMHTKRDEEAGDFWAVVKNLVKKERQFDCVVLDPPYFSDTKKGRFDLTQDYLKLLRKVRPLVRCGGHIATVNNSLFLAGNEYWSLLEAACVELALKVNTKIDVPDDFLSANQENWQAIYPENPAPFNHATKMTILTAI